MVHHLVAKNLLSGGNGWHGSGGGFCGFKCMDFNEKHSQRSLVDTKRPGFKLQMYIYFLMVRY